MAFDYVGIIVAILIAIGGSIGYFKAGKNSTVLFYFDKIIFL